MPSMSRLTNIRAKDMDRSFDNLLTELKKTITNSAAEFNDRLQEVTNPMEVLTLLSEYQLFTSTLNAQVVDAITTATTVIDKGGMH